MTWLAIALGGALGALARAGVGALALALPLSGPAAPVLATLAVNVLGCGAAGALIGASQKSGGLAWMPFLLTGVLGGFTTFSAFSVQVLDLARLQWHLALGYVLLSLILPLAAAALGYHLHR